MAERDTDQSKKLHDKTVKRFRRKAVAKGLLGFSSLFFSACMLIVAYQQYRWYYSPDEVFLMAVIACAGALWLGYKAATGSLRDRRMGIRVQNYVALLCDRPGMTMEALARAVSVPEGIVRDDFKVMLERGYFSGGYFTEDGQRFVLPRVDGGAGGQFTAFNARQDAPAPERAAFHETETDRGAKGLDGAFDQLFGTDSKDSKGTRDAKETKESEDMLKRIELARSRIRNASVAAKIARIQDISAHIFMAVSDRPGGKGQIGTFMGYYLPTTLKILEAYARYEEQSIKGQNVMAASHNIENILDKLVDGFEKQLDRLYEGEMLDISVEIEALEAMLKRDGLDGGAMRAEATLQQN